MQSSSRAVWAVVQGSRPSCTSYSRLVHSSARNPLIRPFGQPFASSIPGAFGAGQDVHVHKRRRYSSHQSPPTPAPLSEQAEQDVSKARSPSLHHNNEAVESLRPGKEQSKPRNIKRAEDRDPFGLSSTETGLEGDNRPRKPSEGDRPGKDGAAKGKNKRVGLRDLAISKKKEPWQVQKHALKEKFGDAGWNPRKKLSPDTMEGIRALHEQDPDRWSTPVLADHFKVSPEAIRRILKSKWRPSEKEMEKRRERWAKRHDRIWDKLAELGLRPQRTKEKPLEGPDEFEENLRAKEILDNARNA